VTPLFGILQHLQFHWVKSANPKLTSAMLTCPISLTFPSLFAYLFITEFKIFIFIYL